MQSLPADAEPPDATPPRRKWPRRAAMSLLGVLVGLAISEAIFRARDRAAFPHLNIYLSDPELGVRLEPNATQKVALPGDRVTTVRTNGRGLRGAELPKPTADEIIVVGDSQVFGLGVEEGETFAALLSTKAGGRQVINAGVPTYGPLEYEKMAATLLAERQPAKSTPNGPRARRTVVYVVNLANDVAELNSPNTQRHKVWDGWAVRAESAPPTVTDFPGRSWLYRNSHAFYALRSWLYARGPVPDERLLPSESAARGLLDEAGLSQGLHDKADADTASLARLWHDEVEKAGQDAVASEAAWTELLQKTPEAIPSDSYGQEYKQTKGDPGDLVERGAETFFEGEGKIDYAYLVKGAAVRAYVEKQILARAKDVLTAEKGKLVLDSFSAREEAEKRVTALRAKSLALATALTSPLRPSLERMKKLCDEHGADLVVVALPIDVQVSADEWKKYGTAPLDMAPTRLLNRDLVDAAASLGIIAIDLLPALEKAEPGAFFERDLHLTPKGHAAVAEAIAAQWTQLPPTLAQPAIALTAGRTHVPLPSAWKSAKPLVVNTDVIFPAPRSDIATASRPLKGKNARFRGKIPDGCEAKRIDEWFRVVCTTPSKGPAPTGVIVRKAPANGHAADVLSMSTSGLAMVMAPLVYDSDRLEVDFAWGDAVRSLVVELQRDTYGLPAGTSTWEWSLTFGETKPLGVAAKPAFVTTEGADALCACQKSIAGDATCAELIGAPDHDCAQTYGSDCRRLLECVRGEPMSPPTCQSGWVPAGSARRCHRSCDGKSACDAGEACLVVGEEGGNAISACLASYTDPAAETKVPGIPAPSDDELPSPRLGGASGTWGSSGFVLFGGCTPTLPGKCVALGDTWRWNGRWELQEDTPAPSPRFHLAMTCDTTRGTTVLFGGTADTAGLSIDASAVGEGYDDTWEFDGWPGRWTKQNNTTSPGPRVGAKMAYDERRKLVVLFGGASRGTWLADTWLWNGRDWTKASPAHSPPARAHHMMAYDDARANVVLFGGHDGKSQLGDTWLWNGSDWTRADTTVAPSARAMGGMAFDGERLVLFGGARRGAVLGSPVSLAETWLWDGDRWALHLPMMSASPSARSLPLLTGGAIGSAVLFGGRDYTSGTIASDVWEWRGETWAPQR